MKPICRIPGFGKQSADYQQIMLELNIADDYFKALERADQMEEQKNRMEKETYSLKHELVGAQMRLDAVLQDLEDRQRQIEELTASKSRLEREFRAARKQAERSRVEAESAQEEAMADSEDFEDSESPESLKNPEISETSEMKEAASGEETQGSGSSRAEELSEEELAKRALQAARKAGSYRNGRR